MKTDRFCQLRNALLLFLLSAAAVQAEPGREHQPVESLELAVAPFLPTAMLVQNYQPLRAYLEQQLRQPVLFVTAPDYKTFYERTQRGEYSVIITVAHAAYLAETEAGYIPMLRPAINTCPALVVAKNSNLTRIQDLRGKSIALPDPLAIISMQGTQQIRASGLDPDNDVDLKYLPNHSAAVNYVIAGEVAAAITSDRALLQMPASTQAAVRVIKKWKQVAAPGVVYLANPSLSPQRVAQLNATILKFVHDTPEGREFIARLGYGDLVPATKQDLEPLASYGKMFKKLLVRSSDKQDDVE